MMFKGQNPLFNFPQDFKNLNSFGLSPLEIPVPGTLFWMRWVLILKKMKKMVNVEGAWAPDKGETEKIRCPVHDFSHIVNQQHQNQGLNMNPQQLMRVTKLVPP